MLFVTILVLLANSVLIICSLLDWLLFMNNFDRNSLYNPLWDTPMWTKCLPVVVLDEARVNPCLIRKLRINCLFPTRLVEIRSLYNRIIHCAIVYIESISHGQQFGHSIIVYVSVIVSCYIIVLAYSRGQCSRRACADNFYCWLSYV